MAVTLNQSAYEHAQRLIRERHGVLDGRDDWREHRPSAHGENRFIEEHGFDEYRRWYLGVDYDEPEDRKGRYKFPYGDFKDVHRCAIRRRVARRPSTSTSTSNSPSRTCTAC